MAEKGLSLLSLLLDRNHGVLRLHRIAYRKALDLLIRTNLGPGHLHHLIWGQILLGDDAKTQVVLSDLPEGLLRRAR